MKKFTFLILFAVFTLPGYSQYFDLTNLPSTGTYKLNSIDSIPNDSITTGIIKSICTGSKLTIPFTNTYYNPQNFSAGFSVELSDSSGSFAQTVIIGTGSSSPITCNIPYFNLQGLNYHVRVVSNSVPQIIGSPNVTPIKIYSSAPPQISYSNLTTYSWISCPPVTMFVGPIGNYSVTWYKNTYDNYSTFNYFTSGNPISPALGDDDYIAHVIDTTTGCIYDLKAFNVYGSTTNNQMHFSLPATVCSNAGPVALIKATLHGTFTGNGVYGDWFYPDSANLGTAGITYTTFDTVPCYSPDTTLFINVDSCTNPLKTVAVNHGLKNKFCVGDSLIVDFEADSTFFAPGTKYYLQLSYPSGDFGQYSEILDSSYSSPFLTIAKTLYNGSKNFRLRVITLNPGITGTQNTEGYLSIYNKPAIRKFYTPQNVNSNCKYGINILHALADGSIYNWHHDGAIYTDSSLNASGIIYTDTSSSFLALSNGYYWVDITNEGGCTAITDSIFITDSTHLVNATINPASQYKCPFDTAYINIQTDSINGIAWFFNSNVVATNNPFQIAAPVAGTYNATVTNSWGCKLNLSAIVNQIYLPSVKINLVKTYVCIGDSSYMFFNSTAGYTNISWYKNGVLQAGNNNYFYAQDSGLYHASFYWGSCQVFTDTVFLQVRQRPVVNFVTDSLYYCSNAGTIHIEAYSTSTTATAHSWHIESGTYLKYTNTYSDTLIINSNPGLSNGIYTISLFNNGCNSAKDTLWIFPYTMPTNTLITTDSTSFCIGDSAQLSATYTGGSNYLWLLNGTDTLSNDTATTLYAYAQGSYTVTVTDSVCKNISNAITITAPCVTGLKDITGGYANTVYVTPNPAYNIIVLHAPLVLKNAPFELHEASGKLVFTGIIEKTETSIILRDYRPGIYFLKAGDSYVRVVKLRD